MNTKKFISKLLYSSVAIAGLFTAIIILFAPEGDIAAKGVGTAFLILLADAFIIGGLLARYDLLKMCTWIASIYSLAVATFSLWYEAPRALGRNSSYMYDSTEQKLNSMLNHLTVGGYILVVGLVFVSAFTLLVKFVDESNELMNYSYKGTLALSIAGVSVLSLSASLHEYEFPYRLAWALIFLAFTSGVIFIISLVMAASKRTAEAFEKMRGSNSSPQEMTYNNHPNNYQPTQSSQNLQNNNGMNNQAQMNQFNNQNPIAPENIQDNRPLDRDSSTNEAQDNNLTENEKSGEPKPPTE